MTAYCPRNDLIWLSQEKSAGCVTLARTSFSMTSLEWTSTVSRERRVLRARGDRPVRTNSTTTPSSAFSFSRNWGNVPPLY